VKPIDRQNEKMGLRALNDDRARALEIVTALTNWARLQEDIRGLALVGSHARNAARPDSDIDIVCLSKNPDRFRDTSWLVTIEWSRLGFELIKWSDEEYGALWSRRMRLKPDCELEFGFTSLSWADTGPVDRGTAKVISDGCRILYDPDGLLERLNSVWRGPFSK
jgi:hypothetical protein